MAKIEPIARNLLYQVGTIRSLLQGVDEGDLTFAELAHYGDFGLGTFDRVSGEMAAVDGSFFRVDAEGLAHAVSPSDKTPFAMVTRFQADREFDLAAIKDLESLKKRIAGELPSHNLIYALRIEGAFEHIKLRSEHPQPDGHQPLARTLPGLQTTFEFDAIEGDLIGFWFPRHLESINVPDFHFHFLDADRRLGGHVFDVRLSRARCQVQDIHDLGMHLMHTKLFEERDLGQADKAAQDKVEKG